jgi:uncharacterized protein involved in exopolysaccharide biosynthesis
MTSWTRNERLAAAFKLAAIVVFILPIAAAAFLSFSLTKKYEATVWMILDASRGPQSVAGTDDRRSGNEVVTYDQLLRTQLAIAGSDDVVLKAVQGMRPTRLYPAILAGDGTQAEVEATEAELARNSIGLSLEPNTFVFKLAFRHKDPVIAARFANMLAQTFLSRRSSLYSNAGDVDFFKLQENRFNDELHEASKALDAFERQYSIYSVSEQRRFLLERRSLAAKEASDNATQVARVESELYSLKTQMLALRGRITLPPEIFGVKASAAAEAGAVRAADILSKDPPLLNIKIYQDSAARLVSANAELEGLKATEIQRGSILADIDAELQALASQEATYNRLQRAVAQAEAAIINLSKQAGEARINNAWRSNEAFSSAQVLQAASTPKAPVSPRPGVYLSIGLIVGVFASLLTLFTGQRLGLFSLGFVRRILPHEVLNDQAEVGRVSSELTSKFSHAVQSH